MSYIRSVWNLAICYIFEKNHFSILQGDNDDLTESLRVREKCLGEFLSIAGMSPEEVMTPPPKYDSEAHSYCPLCETEFLQGVDVCPDCRLSLQPFAP